MHSRSFLVHASLLSILCLLLAFPATAAEVVLGEASAPGVVEPAPQAPPPAEEGFVYGPIRATDPDTRLMIKQLYRDQHELELATHARLDEIVAALATETDPDFRLALQREAESAKEEMLIESTRLGLEIARLNEDPERVAQFESALDHLLNPEKYLPEPLDASVAQERARREGRQ